MKKTAFQALFFLFIVYALLGLWQIRNYLVSGNAIFSTVLFDDPLKVGLYKSYSRAPSGMAPVAYYLDSVWRCFLSLMTRPGSFKYFHWPALTVFEKGLGYAWVVLWMVGFFYGIVHIRRNICYQFLLFVVICFVVGSIWAELWFVGERYRISMWPFIAIISAYGWGLLIALFKSARVQSLFSQWKKRIKSAQ